MGGRMNLSARLADEELRLRRALRKAWEGGKPEVERMLTGEWGVPAIHRAPHRVVCRTADERRADPGG